MAALNQQEAKYHPCFPLSCLLALHLVGCHSKPFAFTRAFPPSWAISAQPEWDSTGGLCRAQHGAKWLGWKQGSHKGPSGAFPPTGAVSARPGWFAVPETFSQYTSAKGKEHNDLWALHLEVLAHHCRKWDFFPPSSNTCELFKYPVCTQPYSAVTDAIRWSNLSAEPTLMKCTVSWDLENCDQHCSSRAGSGWTKPCWHLC